MDTYAEVVVHIIKGQQNVMGPLAVDLAKHVTGLVVKSTTAVTIKGDPKDILTDLVNEYAHLFGQASIEVCRDAVREMKPAVPVDQLPDILK